MVQLIGRYAGRGCGACLRHAWVRTRPQSQVFIPIRTLTERSDGLDLQALGAKWRQKRETLRLHPRQDTRPERPNMGKMYILAMFPYPSGDLHMGHMRVYTISDVLSRFRRMQGYEVIHPIGWDAFGLPAENAANERGIDPGTWTDKNIQKMKGQMEAMNCNFDWSRELRTCDPSFYKHTQRLFLLLHKCGLAYQAEAMVNYDPVDKTVLANEQVDTNGISWRSGAKVEKRMLKQWFFKISEFREELLADLESLEGLWPERVLAMQKNWLGKSAGARIKFPVIAYDQRTHSDIEVFTTRPDTLFGVQYIALASTHPIVQKLAKDDVELQAFLDTMPALPPDSKVGYLLPHVRAINPLAYEESTPDATKASLPIYVTSYVLGDYGDGAVMGVPGHDARDHAFWKHNRYDEPIRMVISQSADEVTLIDNEPFLHHGELTSHSGVYAGLTTADATSKIVQLLEFKGLGSAAETWRLRDWLISRQRYWGTPIPIIHCESCGPVPVAEDQLPVELPPWTKTETGHPLEHAHEWLNTTCPTCSGPAKRDTDTMDTFVDSSWYFMRFLDPHNEGHLFDSEIAEEFLPVDLYVGGVEHAILHLLYARFISKFIAATSLWNSRSHGEPFQQLLAQGMVHGKTYSDPSSGRFLKPNEVDFSVPSKPVVVATGQTANVSFEKMSKSKYNGVDPMGCMDRHSADATRAHILFQAPVSEILEWDEDKISGITRWLNRIYDHIIQLNARLDLYKNFAKYTTIEEFNPKLYFLDLGEIFAEKQTGPVRFDSTFFEEDKLLWLAVQSTILTVTKSYSSTYSLNTVVSDLMSLTKVITEAAKSFHTGKETRENDFTLYKIPDERTLLLQKRAVMTLLQMLAPIAPDFADEMWSLLNQPAKSPKSWLWTTILGSSDMSVTGSVHDQLFPEEDGTLEMLAPMTQPCAVQVNGKLKVVAQIPIPDERLKGKDLETWIVQEILQAEEWKTSQVSGKLDISKAKKVIVVRGGKTVNFVL